MSLFVPTFDWGRLEREEIAYGTTRSLRVIRVGRVFFVESASIERTTEEANIAWKVVAVSKGEDNQQSYKDAMQFLYDANVEVMKRMRADAAKRSK